MRTSILLVWASALLAACGASESPASTNPEGTSSASTTGAPSAAPAPTLAPTTAASAQPMALASATAASSATASSATASSATGSDAPTTITGYIVALYTCPPCPPRAMCKPCEGDYIVVSAEQHPKDVRADADGNTRVDVAHASKYQVGMAVAEMKVVPTGRPHQMRQLE